MTDYSKCISAGFKNLSGDPGDNAALVAYIAAHSGGGSSVFTNIIFVDVSGVDATADGTTSKPFKTAQAAYNAANTAGGATLMSFGVGSFGDIVVPNGSSYAWNSLVGIVGCGAYFTNIGNISGDPTIQSMPMAIPYIGQCTITSISSGGIPPVNPNDTNGSDGSPAANITIFGDGTAIISELLAVGGDGQSPTSDDGFQYIGGNGGNGGVIAASGIICGLAETGGGNGGNGINGGSNGNPGNFGSMSFLDCNLTSCTTFSYSTCVVQNCNITSANFIGGYTDAGGNIPASIIASSLIAVGNGTSNPITYANFSYDGNTCYAAAFRRLAGGNASKYATVPGIIYDYITAVNNTGTGETTLYTDTLPASVLANSKDKLNAFYSILVTGGATVTTEIRWYFGATAIFDSGALSITATDAVTLKVFFVRTGSSTASATFELLINGFSTLNQVKEVDLTGLSFGSTNLLKLTGQSGGAGGGSNKITAKHGFIRYEPGAV